MRTNRRTIFNAKLAAALMFMGVSAVLSAQSPNGPAAREISAPSIVSPKFAGSVFNIIPLSNGKLLINDVRNHRVMLSDSLLRETTTVIDSMDYGSRSASLMRYPGDSVMFVESITPSMTIIDPNGKVVRSGAVANPRDIGWVMPTPSNMAGVDARGRIIHRGVGPRPEIPRIKPGEVRNRTFPDTNPIMRDNPVTHAPDTVAWFRSIRLSSVEVARADGRSMSYSRQRPVDIVDEWAVLSNGMLAVVRGIDYHVDLYDADNKVTSLPRIPFAWERLSDDAKVALADSANKAYDERMKARAQTIGSSGGSGSSVGSAGSSSSSSSSGGGSGGGMGAPPDLASYPLPPKGSMDVKPAEIPDYRAAFELGAVKADAEGNVWVRTTQRVGNDTLKAVFDVINTTGNLIDRIIVPTNRSIVGFDKRGNMFLIGREDGGIQWIERVRWKK